MLVKYIFIDDEELEKFLPELNKYNDELPLVLFEYIDTLSYFSRVSDDVITSFYERRHDVQIVDNPLDYVEYDFRVWIKDNPEFESLLREEIS